MSSKQSVRKELIKAGIKIRGSSNHHGNPSQVKYGQRKVKQKLVMHKTEQRVIDAVRRMRDEGLSLRAIARCLDDMKIPTKNRGKKLHPEMVKRILNNISDKFFFQLHKPVII